MKIVIDKIKDIKEYIATLFIDILINPETTTFSPLPLFLYYQDKKYSIQYK